MSPITVEWASLVELDLSKFDQGDEAREELSKVLLESLHTTGFLYLVNHGIEEETVSFTSHYCGPTIT